MSDLTLFASGLLSRWGFGDGDVVDDWWWEEFDGPPPVEDALEQLVEQLLLPVLTEHGHTFEAYRIGTIHNPIRLRVLDGEPVDVYADDDNRQLDDIFVTVTPAQARLAIAAKPGGSGS